MAGKGGKADIAAELKGLRKARTELAAQNEKAERELQASRARAAATQDEERLKRVIELEKRGLESEQKRARDLSDQLKREVPREAAKEGEEEEARTVELGQTQKSAKVATDPFHSFVIVKRFFGVGEFAKTAKKEAGVVGKTKKLVGM